MGTAATTLTPWDNSPDVSGELAAQLRQCPFRGRAQSDRRANSPHSWPRRRGYRPPRDGVPPTACQPRP
ncbi:hypothetical protein E5345_11795 [Propionibacterium sp. NM47_B9-13]|nr:hypothetical protein E5345_11795 [Propionibacterium sp. NM47_B9-13]